MLENITCRFIHNPIIILIYEDSTGQIHVRAQSDGQTGGTYDWCVKIYCKQDRERTDQPDHGHHGTNRQGPADTFFLPV